MQRESNTLNIRVDIQPRGSMAGATINMGHIYDVRGYAPPMAWTWQVLLQWQAVPWVTPRAMCIVQAYKKPITLDT